VKKILTLNHGFRRLHTFVFQRFLNLICYKQLHIDFNSNGSINLFFCYVVCVFAYKVADIVSVYTFPPAVLHPKHWNVKDK